MPSLKDKITSLEQYLEVEAPDGTVMSRYRNNDLLLLGPLAPLPSFTEVKAPHDLMQALGLQGVNAIPQSLWWLHRELMRTHYAIYPMPTALIKRISQLAPWAHLAPHMSLNDPGNVGYTPSAEYGVADRQVSIALGRFLRKTFLALSDPMIGRMEARHRMELNPEVEFIVAAERPDDFYAAYMRLNSCMAKPPSTFATPIHPIRCYCVPGWQLAVLKNEGGVLSARSLVWVNPQDVNDKRYVRTYGDQMLEGWLLGHGFRRKGFQGAQLHTQVIAPAPSPDDLATLVCPYIDTGTHAAEGVNGFGLWDGGDRITLMNAGTVPQNARTKHYLFSVQNSGARSHAKQFQTRRICAITGVEADTREQDFVPVMIGDTVLYGLQSAVEERKWKLVFYNNSQVAHVPLESPTFEEHGRIYLDSEEVRKIRGHLKLSEKYYPNEQDWKTERGTYTLLRVDHWVKNTDVVTLIDGDPPRHTYIHSCELLASAVRVAPIEHKTYAAAGVPVVRTNTNRKVVKGIHPIAMGWDGQWYFRRSMRQVLFQGEPVFIPKEGTLHVDLPFTQLPPQALRRYQMALMGARDERLTPQRALALAIFDVMSPSGGGLRAPTVDLSTNGCHQWGLFRTATVIPVEVLEEFLDRTSHEDNLHPSALGSHALALWSVGRLIRSMLKKDYPLTPPPEITNERAEDSRAEPASVGTEVREPARNDDVATGPAPAPGALIVTRSGVISDVTRLEFGDDDEQAGVEADAGGEAAEF